MKSVSKILILIFALGVAVPSFAADGSPATKAPATKVSPKADAQPAAAPVAAPEEKPADKTVEKKAEEPKKETQAWWKGILVTVLEFVFAVVAPILSILIMVLIRKWNLKIEQEKVDWVLDKALGFGEQKLKIALKEGKEVEGPEIAKAALEHGNKLLDKYGLGKKFGEWLADGIEARLGQKVVEAGGAKKVVNGG